MNPNPVRSNKKLLLLLIPLVLVIVVVAGLLITGHRVTTNFNPIKTKTTTITGKITKVQGQNLTIKSDQGEQTYFVSDKAALIIAPVKDAKNIVDRLKGLETSSDTLIRISLINNKYEVVYIVQPVPSLGQGNGNVAIIGDLQKSASSSTAIYKGPPKEATASSKPNIRNTFP